MKRLKRILGISDLSGRVKLLEKQREIDKEAINKLRRDLVRLKSLTETLIDEFESYYSRLGQD
jgi:hypothetical protein